MKKSNESVWALILIALTVLFVIIWWAVTANRSDYEIKTNKLAAVDSAITAESLDRYMHDISVAKPVVWRDNFSIDGPLTEKHTEQAVVTAYCPCVKCCGQWSSDIRGGVPTTASGTHATSGRTVGADPKLLPYGTHIWIGDHEYVVEDTGSGLTKGMLHIDIYCNTHKEALQVGYSIREISWETIAE